MANTFKSSVSQAVGTVSTSVYTVPASTTTTIIGLSLSNILTTAITVSATLTKGATTVSIIKNAPIPPGSSLVLFGGDQKLVMETGNILKVISNTAASVDAIVSYLQIV